MNLGLLEELVRTPGVSGHETRVKKLLIEKMKGYVDEVSADSFGNVSFRTKGNGGPRVMVCAHMDEIGLAVTRIDDNGYIRVIPIGYVDARILPGKKVIIYSADEEHESIPGIIGIKPIHFQKPDDAKREISVSDLHIDIGCSSKEEVERLGIEPGSAICFEKLFDRLQNDRLSGTSLDNRAGVYVMAEVAKAMQKAQADIYWVASCQEEVGLRGAKVAAFGIDPQLSIVLDVAIATDTPDLGTSFSEAKLGGGPIIVSIDKGIITNRKLINLVKSVAKKHNIPLQFVTVSAGRTDGAEVSATRAGVPTIQICLPLRYAHNPAEIVDLKDITATVTLVKGVIEEFGNGW